MRPRNRSRQARDTGRWGAGLAAARREECGGAAQVERTHEWIAERPLRGLDRREREGTSRERRVAAMARDGAKPRASAGGSSRRHPGVHDGGSGVDDPRICVIGAEARSGTLPKRSASRSGSEPEAPHREGSHRDRRGRHVGNCSPLAASRGSARASVTAAIRSMGPRATRPEPAPLRQAVAAPASIASAQVWSLPGISARRKRSWSRSAVPRARSFGSAVRSPSSRRARRLGFSTASAKGTSAGRTAGPPRCRAGLRPGDGEPEGRVTG